MQKNRGYKVSSYTLNEVIIVLIITTIVISLAFSVLGLISKQISKAESNSSKSVEVSKLKLQMIYDLNKANKMTYDLDTEALQIFHFNDTISYDLEGKIVRKQVDTFSIPVVRKRFFYLGNEVFDDRIDALELLVNLGKSEEVLFVSIKETALSKVRNIWE